MWLTYRQTVPFHGMMDTHVMCLTYGQTSDGMTDGRVLLLTYRWMSQLNGTSYR